MITHLSMTGIKKYSLLNLFILMFAFLFVFITIDGNTFYQSDFTLFFRKWFVKPRPYLLYLNLFEISLAIITILLLSRNRIVNLKKIKTFFGLTVWIYFADTFFYIFNFRDTSFLYINKIIILMFVFTLVLIDKKLYVSFILKFAKYIIIFFCLKILLLSYFYITEKYVVTIHFINSISIEEDFNIFVSLIACLFLGIFLASKKKKYLILYFCLFFFQVLTFRRSGIFNLLIISIALIIYMSFYKQKSVLSFLKKNILIFFIIVFTGFVLQFLQNNDTTSVYMGRYFSAFVKLDKGSEVLGAKNDHFKESEYAFQKAIELPLPFWGVGSESSDLPIKFRNISGIHNAYISVWMIYSFGNLLCLLSFIIIYIKYSFITIMKPSINTTFHSIKITIVLFLFVYFLLLWVSPSWNWIATKSQILLLILLSILARSNDIEYFIYNNYLINRRDRL
jgi:hypothetical protein